VTRPVSDVNRLIVVGGSAGGIESAGQLLASLPAELGAPVFVVIHIPSHTPSSLPDVLQRRSRLPVYFASNDAPIHDNVVYVAPPGRHLMLDEGTMRVTFGPKESRARPSVDVLFRSAAMTYGPRVIAVIVSGALDDGTPGAWAVKDRGGVVVVEDPATALFPAMPQSVLAHVEVDASLPLEKLGEYVASEAQAPLRPHATTPIPPHWNVETMIARQANAFNAGCVDIGNASHFSCPECGGVMSEIKEGKIRRFRCHTGHAYSSEALLSEIDNGICENLWSAVRATEERILLLRQLAETDVNADISVSARYRELATLSEDFLSALRRSALDSAIEAQGR
jgi:two-component system, chemotaxis family, protein-glutamate methylesterase/glutaminase